MKAVLISIQPKWCELIASGKKTIEVRKTRPKIETPFKCYIYMTAGDAIYPVTINGAPYTCSNVGGTCVIGEFVCDLIEPYWCALSKDEDIESCEDVQLACLSAREIKDYGGERDLYFWHISDLVIYDKQREINTFFTEGDCTCENCKKCRYFDRGNGYNVEDDCLLPYEYLGTGKTLKPLFRPPQSWCYVEGERE